MTNETAAKHADLIDRISYKSEDCEQKSPLTNERVAEDALTNERVPENALTNGRVAGGALTNEIVIEEENKNVENRRPYVCDVCENMFDKLTQLEQHRKDTDIAKYIMRPSKSFPIFIGDSCYMKWTTLLGHT